MIVLIQEQPLGGVTKITILLDFSSWTRQIFSPSIDTHRHEPDMANAEGSPGDTPDFGDFVRNEEQEIILEELAEPWHRYDEAEDNPHVLYPVCLGEVLNERYLVEHKLGFGGGSTVWMAFDQQDKKAVALKVMALGDWADNETRIQDEIAKTVHDTSRLVIYTATFFLPRGNDDQNRHRALVFPLKGPSPCTITLKKTPMASRMSAARQLLETVASLHQAGIMHRGRSIFPCSAPLFCSFIFWSLLIKIP